MTDTNDKLFLKSSNWCRKNFNFFFSINLQVNKKSLLFAKRPACVFPNRDAFDTDRSPRNMPPLCNWSVLWNTAGCHYKTWLLLTAHDDPPSSPKHTFQLCSGVTLGTNKHEILHKPTFGGTGWNQNKADADVNISVTARFTRTKAKRLRVHGGWLCKRTFVINARKETSYSHCRALQHRRAGNR